MAVLAFGACMSAGQSELGLRMVEAGLIPLRAGVAGLATLPEIAFVFVIGPMAGNAGCREIDITLVDMTGHALGAPVGGLDRKIRFRMIEADFFPVGFVVAALALGPELPFVRLVGLVARSAVRRRFAIRLVRHVTGPAFDVRVLFPQRIVGQAVIEIDGLKDHDVLFPPGVIGVARAAWLTCRLITSVVAASSGIVGRDLFVAVEAQPRLGGFIEGRMTGFALGFVFGVLCRQRTG